MTASTCQLTFEVVTVIDTNCLCSRSLEVSLEPNAYVMLLMRMSLAGDHLTPAN